MKIFRYREHAVLGVEIVDRELAVLQRATGVDRGLERELAGVERHREGERLEGGAHLVDAGGEAIDAGGVERLARIVGVVVGNRDHRDDLARAHVGEKTGHRQGLEFRARGNQLVAHGVLDAQVDGKLDRLLQAVGGEPGQVQVGEPAPVEPLLDAGDALIVDIDVADEMGDLGAVRIDALVLRQEADAGQPEAMNLLTLLGRDLALEPDEAALGGKPFAQLGSVRVGHDGGQQLGRLVDVDDAVRLAEQRGRADVGRQDFAVAIENVGPRGRHRVVPGGTPRALTVGRGREHHQPGRDDRIAQHEDQDGEPDAGARLGGAVYVAAVKQRPHQPPAPRFVQGFV